uniref:Uncharacterized protein n=1 Tax=Saimiri boliviensis boliviensis TaxID=39432 RepID=A0A2K6UBM0_SAIBB
MGVGSQGRCSRWSRILRGRDPSAERQHRARQPRGPREQAPRVSAPPRHLPAVFPQFALLPQSGPRLILCTCQWAHTSSPGTILPSSTFLTINLPATAGKVAGCEWGREGRFAHAEAPELAARAQMASFLRFSTKKNGVGCFLGRLPPGPSPGLTSQPDAEFETRHPALLTPGLLTPLPKSAARGMLAPTFAAPVRRPAPLPSPKDVPLQ